MDAITFHSNQAAVWSEKYFSPVFAQRIEIISRLIEPYGRWLDAGCGTGNISRWLADRGCSVLAIDASEDMIHNAISHPNVSFAVSDVCSTHIPDESLDGIVCSSVLEYLDNPSQALAEFFRILKPGGTLIASVPNKASRPKLWLAYWITRFMGKARRLFTYLEHSKHSYSISSISRLLSDCGFEMRTALIFSDSRFTIPMLKIDMEVKGSLLMMLAQRTADKTPLS